MSGEAVVRQEMEAGDWRSELAPDARLRIVNKIMETLKRHLPFSGQEGLQDLKRIAVRFEDKIFTAATNKSDYLRKITLKMLTMETKSQNPMTNPLQPNTASNSEIHQDPVRLLEKDLFEDSDNGECTPNPTANPLQPNNSGNSENPQDPGDKNACESTSCSDKFLYLVFLLSATNICSCKNRLSGNKGTILAISACACCHQTYYSLCFVSSFLLEDRRLRICSVELEYQAMTYSCLAFCFFLFFMWNMLSLLLPSHFVHFPSIFLFLRVI